MPPKNSKKRNISEIETDRDAENGNINHSPAHTIVDKKQPNQLIFWFFTWNNYPEGAIETLETCFRQICKKYKFQEEVGEKCGTPHLQGNIQLKKKMRWSEFNLPVQMCWDKTRNMDAAFTYCGKDETRVGRTLSMGFPKPVKLITEFRPFQQSLIDLVDGPVFEGKIHWIHDKHGQLGKTEFLRYLFVKKGVPFTYGGKCADIINLLYNNKEYLLNNETNCAVIYNITRETQPHEVSYSSMEQISDGCISNNKFECGCFVCNKPHVIIFANCEPIRERLTESRWMMYTIDPISLELIRGE